MKRNIIRMSGTILFTLGLIFTSVQCTEEEDPKNNTSDLPAECVGIFDDLEGSQTLTVGVNTGGPGSNFTASSTYMVTFTADGKVTLDSDADDVIFESPDITTCEELSHETNVFYEKNGLNLIVQVEDETLTLVLSNSSGQVTLTYTPGPDVALITTYEGTYNVSSVDAGSHSRMTVTIGSDGSIDFDNGVMYTPTDYELISDRLDCCNAVYVDCTPYPSEPYPRFELIVNSNGDLSGMNYMPQYPNISGRVKLIF